jgi:hypothetical protein
MTSLWAGCILFFTASFNSVRNNKVSVRYDKKYSLVGQTGFSEEKIVADKENLRTIRENDVYDESRERANPT